MCPERGGRVCVCGVDRAHLRVRNNYEPGSSSNFASVFRCCLSCPSSLFPSAQELELLMCGLPVIDLQDWQRHTDYTGEFERKAGGHKV